MTVNGDILRYRARIVSAMRAFFDERGFVEVETPVRIAAPAPEPHIDCPAAPSPDGKAAYLRASPELQMKKLLAMGMDRIYQIGPCFREGEKGARHNPEFTMIEWYRRNSDYIDILNDCESLFLTLFRSTHGDRPFKDRDRPFIACGDRPFKDGDRPFKRVTVREAYRRWAGWDPWTAWDQDRFDFDMATKIEPALKDEGAVFLLDYPPQAASLAKLRGDVAERWELYVDGLELANCFTELCDSGEQRRRFAAARDERRLLGEADYPLDERFLDVLGDIGSAAGVALGVDRLVMTLLGLSAIDAVRVLD